MSNSCNSLKSAEEIFYNNHQNRIYHQTDHVFFWLFIIEWIASIAIAFTVTPNTWIGTEQAIHLHVWMAIFLEGVIISVPLYLIHKSPGQTLTRHCVALSQMMIAAILIHITGGRLETHFHIFGSLALLASYRDYNVLITAAIVVAIDHFIRGIWWPESVFGVLTTSPYRWLEHAGWVLFECVFLIRAIVISQKEMREISSKTAALQQTNESITFQIKQKSQELEQRNAELLQAQKMESIGHLAAGIAHEINTPTQYIGNNIEFVSGSINDLISFITYQEKCLSAAEGKFNNEEFIAKVKEFSNKLDIPYLLEETPRAIQQSIEGVNRVSQIVSAMKDFSHPFDKAKKSTDINKSILTTATVARNEWKYVADLNTEFDNNLPFVECFSDQINQVFLNLIVNAAHSIEEKHKNSTDKGVITVSTQQQGEFIEISIKDTGNGIPEDIKDKIFNPFFTTKKVGKGTGQGLSMAYSIIADQHNGSIRFHSKVEEGTEFIIRLPIYDNMNLGCDSKAS